jgi:hypothetical protein
VPASSPPPWPTSPGIAIERASQIAGFRVRPAPTRLVLGIEAFTVSLIEALLTIYQAPNPHHQHRPGLTSATATGW